MALSSELTVSRVSHVRHLRLNTISRMLGFGSACALVQSSRIEKATKKHKPQWSRSASKRLEQGGLGVIRETITFEWKGWRRFAYDFLIIQVGFLLFGLSIDVLVQANLGLDSWDVLQMALTYHLPLTLGQSSIGVAFLIVLLDVALREPLGWGTLANMFFVGVWVDIMKPYTPSVPPIFPAQVAYLLLGTLIMGFATAIYIGVNAGAGPRDTLMLALSRIGKTSVRVARTCLEVTVVIVGWILGGPAWLGTLIAAISIGPAVQLGFKILKVRPADQTSVN